MANSGFDTKLQVMAIRIAAKEIIGHSCTDYQITFVAMMAGQVFVCVNDLADMRAPEISRLHLWMGEQLQTIRNRRPKQQPPGTSYYA